MPTPTGLPRVGEVWELRIPTGNPATEIAQRAVIISRTQGSYWSVGVAWVAGGRWTYRVWVDAPYYRQKGWLTYIGPAGPKTRAALSLG